MPSFVINPEKAHLLLKANQILSENVVSTFLTLGALEGQYKMTTRTGMWKGWDGMGAAVSKCHNAKATRVILSNHLHREKVLPSIHSPATGFPKQRGLPINTMLSEDSKFRLRNLGAGSARKRWKPC